MSDLVENMRHLAKHIKSDNWTVNGILKEAANLIEQQHHRIAELELVVCALVVADETGYVDGEGFIDGFDKLTSEGEKCLVKHDADTIANAIKECCDNGKAVRMGDGYYLSESFLWEYAERIKQGESL